MVMPNVDAVADKLLSIEDEKERDSYLRGHVAQLELGVIERLKSAVDYFIRSDVRRAMRIAETARAVAAFVKEPLADAVSLRALAEAHHVSSRYREALLCYDRAAHIYRRLDYELDAARVQRNTIGVLMYMGRYPEALTVAEDTRAIFAAHGEENLVAQVDTHVGNIYFRQDDPMTALRYYDRARRVFEVCGDDFARALVEYNRANILALLNEFETAENLYRSARDLYQDRGFHILAADVDYSLSYLCFLRSRYQLCLTSLKEARRLYESGRDQSGVAFCDVDMSELYLRLNIPQEARKSAERACRTFEHLGMRYDEAKARAHVAAATWRLGLVGEALSCFERAEALFRQEGNALQVAIVSVCRAELLLSQGDAVTASRLSREALTIFEASAAQDRRCDARLCLAQAERHQGLTEKAWETAKAALESLGDRERPWLRYRCHYLLGQILSDRGELYAADEHFGRALDDIEAMWHDLRVDEYRVAFLHDKAVVYANAVRLKLSLGGEDAVADAFTCTERGRSRSIVDMLIRHSAPRPRLRDGVAPEVYRRYERLREELDWFYNRAYRRDIGDEKTTRPVEDDRFRDHVHQREREIAELRKTLRQQDHEFSDLFGFFATSAEEVRARLGENEVMLSYFMAGVDLLVFVIQRDGIFVRTCPVTRSVLRDTVEGLRFQLTKFLYGETYVRQHQVRLRQCVDRYLKELFEQLLAPLSEHWEDKDLIVIPHGILHYVPFHALLDRKQYVVERRAVSYAPSAHVYCLCQSRPSRQDGSVVALGAHDEATPFIEKEVELVAGIFPGAELYRGESATRDALFSVGKDCRVLHLAAHGTFRSDNPLLSSLRLSDGPVDVSDIFNLDLDADLVTLSGCETGVSHIASGDELLGLIRGFLHAGATSLLVSQWSVGDRSTAAFMARFYQELKKGTRPRHAVRLAQLALLESYGHPFYWAPFMISGGA